MNRKYRLTNTLIRPVTISVSLHELPSSVSILPWSFRARKLSDVSLIELFPYRSEPHFLINCCLRHVSSHHHSHLQVYKHDPISAVMRITFVRSGLTFLSQDGLRFFSLHLLPVVVFYL